MDSSLTRVYQALSDLATGRPTVLIGSAGRDPDGYLLAAAEKVTTATVAFMVRYGSGFLCAALTGSDCDRVGLPPMVAVGSNPLGNHHTVSVDAVGDGTGISAKDRAGTLRLLADPHSTPTGFTRPGHVIPVRAAADGVITHRGPSEAGADLARLAGLHHVAAFAALVSDNDPTAIADAAESREFARAHHLNWVTVDDVVTYRRVIEDHVSTCFTERRDTPFGTLCATGFHSTATGSHYVAYQIGWPATACDSLVHFYRERDFAPHANSTDTDLQALFAHLSVHEDGVIVVERHVNNRDSLTDTADQDCIRNHDDLTADIAQILRHIGVTSALLLEPLPGLPETLAGFGIGARSADSAPGPSATFPDEWSLTDLA